MCSAPEHPPAGFEYYFAFGANTNKYSLEKRAVTPVKRYFVKSYLASESYFTCVQTNHNFKGVKWIWGASRYLYSVVLFAAATPLFIKW